MHPLHRYLPADALDESLDLPFERRFSAAREERRTPSTEQLLAMSLEDEDELIDVPTEMTGNDAFRIIEIIKEREAWRGR